MSPRGAVQLATRGAVAIIERLLDTKGSISRDDIEAYVAEGDVAAERAEWREAYVKRVLRMHKPQV